MKRTISPSISKMMFGDDVLAGAAKMVFCEHPKQTLFGGHAKPNISKTDGEWHMAVGSLIFVPLKVFEWSHTEVCGYSIEDLLRDGMKMHYWKEKE